MFSVSSISAPSRQPPGSEAGRRPDRCAYAQPRREVTFRAVRRFSCVSRSHRLTVTQSSRLGSVVGTQVVITVDERGADAERLAELTSALRGELLALDPESVEHGRGGALPPGAR